MIDLSARLDAFDDDARMIRDAAIDYCTRDSELRRVRRLRGARPSFDADAWRALAAMGWLGCRLPAESGGLDLPFAHVALILEQHGGALAPEPLTAVGVLAAGALRAGGDTGHARDRLARLAAGEWLPTLAWQETPAQRAVDAIATRATPHDGSVVLHGRKRFVAVGEAAHAFVVTAMGPDGFGVHVVDRDAPGVTITTQPRVDGGTWSDVALDGVRVDADAVVATGPEAAEALERVLDDARVAVAAELVGLMSRALAISVDYIAVREQFGRPVGSFQALQHRAVDLLVLVELSRAVLRQSAARLDATDGDARRRAASQAKARASDAALKVVKGCIQLHGGIGYTDECNIGLFLKRAMVLASWLGDAAQHRHRYGTLAEAADGEDDASAPVDPLVEEARAFLAAQFPAAWRFPATRMSLKATDTWQRALADKGWMAPGWPVEHGGMGLSAYDQIRLNQEFDRHGVMITPNMAVTMLGPLLIRHGTDEQRRRWLPPIVAGTERWCQGYSEPGAGSDLASLRTRAELDGDVFVVNGQKIWTSFAHEADMIFLLVRTDPHAKKQDGISFLLVDMRSPGITVRPIRNLTGESEFCEVFFENVRVPKANLVGEMNRGWTMAKSLLGSERISIGSPRLARYPLNLLHALLVGSGRIDDPVVRAQFDALRLDVDDLDAAFVRTADVLRRGGEPGAEVSILKLWVTETMQRVTDLMVEVQGDEAAVDAPVPLPDGTSVHVANQYFLSRPATIYGGSSEIQRNILAKAVLGLPD